MKTLYKTFRAQICACLFAFAFLQGLHAAITTEVIGIGESLEAAKKDAIANAVRESMGEYVRTKQVLEDENLNEKIVGFSNAYVLDYKQLSAHKNEHGLYEVKAQVEIEDGKLVGVLKDLNVDVRNLDSGNFKVYVDESYKKLEDFKAVFQDTVIEPLKSGEAWETKILTFDPLELTEVYQYCREREGWCGRFRTPERLDYKAYVLTLRAKYQEGYLEGVKKLLSSVGKVCDSGDNSSKGCYAPENQIVGIPLYSDVIRFYALTPELQVLWSLRLDDLFKTYVSSELWKFEGGNLRIRFFDKKGYELPYAPRIFDGRDLIDRLDVVNSQFHIDIRKLDELDRKRRDTYRARSYSPNYHLVPRRGQFLVDAPDIMMVIHLTQEEAERLGSIKATFSLAEPLR
ncbi:hypothetical protein BKN38_00385 [Helicobacter sp. CLO-3]|uniref:hypothetical protein n=1 Tax=unclassified Helicobacter TaxID=2593540 RepID=UPI000805AC8D|nr:MULTISPECIES: hypothetical protein [unclassified Helicobacter]OBV30006.1 hypothetical protein BA723_03010 [Helicobacter sp. CLO-3]OHU85893.1 hypothetical protein BKN38_00385 [Helicobacter sp. CLO-3]